jgi:archaellum biogenesis protein FlaJ (TadC family)
MPVNYARIALAFLGATVAYFAAGFALFAALPGMKREFMKYPNVFRSEDGMKKLMPYGMLSILLSIAIVAVLYAKIYPAGGGVASGVCLGALLGIFAVCVFVIHNYVYLNIGATLALYEGVTYFIQWVIVGAAIGLIYKPS